MLIQASRTLSRVGLTSGPGGALIFRPRQRPATMRTRREAAGGKREAGSGKREPGSAPREAGSGRREATGAVCCSRLTRPDVRDSRLQKTLAPVIVALQSERNVDLRPWLEFANASGQSPPD